MTWLDAASFSLRALLAPGGKGRIPLSTIPDRHPRNAPRCRKPRFACRSDDPCIRPWPNRWRDKRRRWFRRSRSDRYARWTLTLTLQALEHPPSPGGGLAQAETSRVDASVKKAGSFMRISMVADVFKSAGGKADQAAPVVTPAWWARWPASLLRPTPGAVKKPPLRPPGPPLHNTAWWREGGTFLPRLLAWHPTQLIGIRSETSWVF